MERSKDEILEILDQYIHNRQDRILELQNSLNMANLSASQVAQTATILAALTTTTPAAA